jgi:hypothetical protein
MTHARWVAVWACISAAGTAHAQATTTASLVVASDPPDADVYIDGVEVGLAPVDKAVAPGDHVVEVRWAQVTASRVARALDGQSVLVSITAPMPHDEVVNRATPKAYGHSSRGPLYFQAMVAGLSFGLFPGSAELMVSSSWFGYGGDIEAGYHVSGRHDGLAVALRQAFMTNVLPGDVGGSTALRMGWDVLVHLGAFELDLDPFATVGIGYVLNGKLFAGVDFSGGIDAKLFVFDGLYAFARPFEVGAVCFQTSGNCVLEMSAGAGVGIALGGRDP